MISKIDIDAAVSREFGVPLDELIAGKSRTQPLALARQVAMYLIRAIRGLTYNDIGRHYRLTHATILHGVRHVEELMRDDPDLCDRVRKLEAVLVGEESYIETDTLRRVVERHRALETALYGIKQILDRYFAEEATDARVHP